MEVAVLTDAVQVATLGREDHEGLVAEKAKVESNLREHRVKSDKLLDMAVVLGETEEDIAFLVEDQKKFRTT